MIATAVVLGLGASAAGVGAAAAGGAVLYKKQQKKKKLSRQGKAKTKENDKHEELSTKSIEELEAMAKKKGDKYVQYELGLKVAEAKTAENYFRLASKQDHAGAAYEIGKRYFSGEFEPQSEEMALDFYSCAATRGHEEAMIAAGDIHYERGQWKEAKKFYKNCSVNYGNAVAEKKFAITKLQNAEPDLQCQYARSLEETDPKEAVLWYQKAADQDHSESAFRLGKIYLEGNEYITPSEDQAMMLLLQASGNGHCPASLLLSEIFEKKEMYDEALQRLQMCGKTPETKERIEQLKIKAES